MPAPNPPSKSIDEARVNMLIHIASPGRHAALGTREPGHAKPARC